MKPAKTAAERRISRWGTKSYAMVEMRQLLRGYAKARRAWLFDSTRWSKEHDWVFAHAMALGARSALRAVGVLTDAQYAKVSARLERIAKAKVTRRPFADLRRAA